MGLLSYTSTRHYQFCRTEHTDVTHWTDRRVLSEDTELTTRRIKTSRFINDDNCFVVYL